MSKRTALRQSMLMGMLFLSACAQDCSCEGFVPQPFPDTKVDKTIMRTGELRLTSSGIQFLTDNLGDIANALVPGGLGFCIPPTQTSGVRVCENSTCMSGDPGCDVTLTIDRSDIVPTPPSTIEIDVTIGDLNETLPFSYQSADCQLTLYSAADSSQPATIGGKVPISFTVDQASPFKDVQINVGDPEVDLSDVDFDIDLGPNGNVGDFFLCEGADLVLENNFIRDLAIGILQNQLIPLVQEQVDQQLCVQCDEGCGNGSTCDGEGICRYGDDTCQQAPLGLAGQLEIGNLLADFTENPGAKVDMTIRAADAAIVDTGLTLGIRSGYDPVDTALCAPIDPTRRDFTATGLSPTITGNATPFGQPFHFGVGYRKNAIEHMLWSVWGSGATCLNISSSSIDLLSTGSLGALLPSLKQLAYSKTSEAYIKIVPQTEPKVTLGMNTVMPMGSSYTVVDPLITIDWKDFDVHIYGFTQDRFTRIVTIRMDLLLPVAIVSDGMGSITPIIGDLGEAFTNERILGGELVAEDPQRILDLLPTLIGFALPSVADSVSQPIEIPEFFGFRIDIPDENITSVDNRSAIAIFANLVLVAQPYTLGTETTIANVVTDLSEKTPSGLVKPKLFVDMLGFTGVPSIDGAEELEYSYRVNNGTWSFFDRASTLTINDPMLVVPGQHRVEVRARQVGKPETVDRTPDVAYVMIDGEAPVVEIERADNLVSFETADLVDADNLSMRYKVITGDGNSTWTDWGSVEPLDLNSLDVPERFRLDVEVRDRAGNVGKDTQTVTWKMPLERDESAPVTTSDAEPQPVAGCNATGGQGPAGLVWLLLVGAGLGLARRRRRGLRVESLGLAAIVCLGACKCGEDNGEQLVCEPACAIGQQCVDGACVAVSQCSTDEDCPEGERCNAGECVSDPTCEQRCDCPDGEYADCGADGEGECACVPYCDKGCDDGQYCCYDSNTCETLPDPCAEQVCDIGFGPVVTTDSSGVSSSCEVDNGACECQELPPLPLGWHGHYASIDRNGGTTGVAVYNSTYEDLMVGTVDSSLNVTWAFVDGVPSTGDVEGSLNGPRGGISDKGEDVGRFTALAIDDSGTMHVFYRDVDREVLKYARGSGTSWDISDLDTDGDAGWWTSAVHQDGTIHVVYAVKSTAGDNGGFVTELRHVSFDASGAPTDPTATSVVVASGPSAHPCGSDCEARNDVCFASLEQCAEPTSDCGTCSDGQECYQGTCRLIFEEPPVGYLKAVGTHAKLTTTTDGLLVTYYDYTQDSIAYSAFDGSAWSSPTFAGTGTGPWGSGMMDSNGDVHLAYMERVGEIPQLTYRNMSDTQTEAIIDGIRDTAQWWLISDIGEDVDLRLAADGTPTVIFQDTTEHALKLGTRGANGWTVSNIASTDTPNAGAPGFYAAMLNLPDAQFSVQLTIDNQADPTEAQPYFHE